MVRDDMWKSFELDEPDEYGWFLCIGCIERRIGRRLIAADFTDCPVNTTNVCGPKSKRLLDRMDLPATICGPCCN